MQERDQSQLVASLLEQNFEMARHAENIRLGFTSIWAIIVAGVLTFVSQSDSGLDDAASAPAIGFLILLTILGLLMSVRVAYTASVCSEIIHRIASDGLMNRYDPTIGWLEGRTRRIRARWLFVGVYASATPFLAAILAATLI